MADTKTYVITTVSRGMCLETRSGVSVSTGKYDSSGKTQAQLWTLEQSEDKKYTAFRSVANGQYLRSAGRGNGPKAQTGGKAWWKVEPGDAPGLWWLKCTDTDNYLNNYGGNRTANNTVQLWNSPLKAWDYALLWYIFPSKMADSFSFSAVGGSATSEKDTAESEAKQKAMNEHQENLDKREKELTDREAGIRKQAEDADAREKAVSERERKVAKSESSSKEVEAKEKALSERKQKLEEREKAMVEKENSKAETSSDSTQLFKVQQQLANAHHELTETKNELEKERERSANSGAQDILSSSKKDPYSGTPSDEVVRLRTRVAELESQVKSNNSHAASAKSVAVDQKSEGGLRPIVMRQNFGFLPRLTQRELEFPQEIVLPAETRV